MYRVLVGKSEGRRPLGRPKRRWVDNIRMYRVLVGKPEGRNHWGDLDVDGWIILGCICRRWDVGIWIGLGWPSIETGGGRL